MALFTRLGSFSRLGNTVFNACLQDCAKRGIKRFVAPLIRETNRRLKKVEPLPIEKTKRSHFIEWNYNAEIYAFGKRLGEEFNIELLLEAFINRSYIVQEELKQEKVGIENPKLALKDNQLLAKKGEAIISEEVKRCLSINLPRLPLEGIIAIHNYLLSDEIIGFISKNLGTSEIILSSDYPVETFTLAITLKAVVGALAESQSVERANKFVREIILTHLAEKDLNDIYIIKDPMKVLTNILAQDGREPPEPRLIGQSAANDILACYTVGMYCAKKLIGQGPGETVEIAIEMAAHDALKRLFGTADFSKPLRFDIECGETPSTNLQLSAWRTSAFQRPS